MAQNTACNGALGERRHHRRDPQGLVVLPEGRRRAELEKYTDLIIWFRGRVLPVTHSIADRWGALDGECQLRGTPLNTADGMIAATALERGLTVVTRNVRDFAGLGVNDLQSVGWDLIPANRSGDRFRPRPSLTRFAGED